MTDRVRRCGPSPPTVDSVALVSAASLESGVVDDLESASARRTLDESRTVGVAVTNDREPAAQADVAAFGAATEQ